jgi:hypothetical protein
MTRPPLPRMTCAPPSAILLSVLREGMAVDSAASISAVEAAALCTLSLAAPTRESSMAGMLPLAFYYCKDGGDNLALCNKNTQAFRGSIPPVTAAQITRLHVVVADSQTANTLCLDAEGRFFSLVRRRRVQSRRCVNGEPEMSSGQIDWWKRFGV